MHHRLANLCKILHLGNSRDRLLPILEDEPATNKTRTMVFSHKFGYIVSFISPDVDKEDGLGAILRCCCVEALQEMRLDWVEIQPICLAICFTAPSHPIIEMHQIFWVTVQPVELMRSKLVCKR